MKSTSGTIPANTQPLCACYRYPYFLSSLPPGSGACNTPGCSDGNNAVCNNYGSAFYYDYVPPNPGPPAVAGSYLFSGCVCPGYKLGGSCQNSGFPASGVPSTGPGGPYYYDYTDCYSFGHNAGHGASAALIANLTACCSHCCDPIE